MQSGHFCIHSKTTRWGRCNETLSLRSGLFGASERELVHRAIFENFLFNCNLAVYLLASHHSVSIWYDIAMTWVLEVLWNCWTSTIWFCGCNNDKTVSHLIFCMNFTIIIYECTCSVQSVAKHYIASHQSSFPGHILDMVGTVKSTFYFSCFESLLGSHGHVTAINTCMIDIKCELSLVNLCT